MLFQCWASVEGDGPTLKQHCPVLCWREREGSGLSSRHLAGQNHKNTISNLAPCLARRAPGYMALVTLARATLTD